MPFPEVRIAVGYILCCIANTHNVA